MKKIVVMILFTVFLLICLVNIGKLVEHPAKTVQVSVVTPTTEKQYVICTGKISEENASEIYASHTGRIDKLMVSQGETVKKGQLIMQLTKDDTVQAPVVSSESDGQLPDGLNIPSDFDFNNAMEVYNSMQKNDAVQSPTEEDAEDEVLNIYAPTDGIVRALDAEENGGVETGDPLCVISKNPDSLTVDLSINENQIADVQVGQTVEISGAGFKNSVYTGIVTSISSVARQALVGTGMETVVDVKVKINGAGEDVKPGFTSTVKIITAEKGNTIIVPYESVRAENDGTEYVFVLQDGRVQKRYIKTGVEFEVGFEVLNGLKPGDPVIRDPDGVQENEVVRAVR